MRARIFSRSECFRSFDDIIGVSVSATKPDTTTAPASVTREFEEKPARAPRREGDGRIDRSQRHRHGDDRKAHFPRPSDRRIEGLHALFHMPVDVLEHDDGVIDHKPDGQHEGQQRQRVHRESRRIHDGKGGDAATPGW